MPTKAIAAGLIGGVVGAAVWAGLYVAGWEIGWLAWGIGGLVGICVRAASGNNLGLNTALIAALLAAVSVAGGKYAGLYIDIHNAIGELSSAVITDENYTSFIADDVARQYLIDSKQLHWPRGAAQGEGWVEADYPVDVWSDAAALWGEMTPAQQESFRQSQQSSSSAFSATNEFFAETFSFWDILWFGLAVVTAFKLGADGDIGE